MGKPKKSVPSEKLSLITELAGRGVSEGSIARALGMAPCTFTIVKREDAAVQQAIDVGRAVEHDALVGVLFEAATKDKNIVAAMFLLKARHGYREGESQVGNQVAINITLPGAMKPDDYVEVINGTAKPLKLPK